MQIKSLSEFCRGRFESFLLRTYFCSEENAKVVLEAAVAAGAPEGIIGWIDIPSLDLTNMVMQNADIILATGGPGMVKAAYAGRDFVDTCGFMVVVSTGYGICCHFDAVRMGIDTFRSGSINCFGRYNRYGIGKK